MENFFKNKKLLSVIAAILIIAAVFIIPKLTGKTQSNGELELETGDPVQTETSSTAETSRPPETEESTTAQVPDETTTASTTKATEASTEPDPGISEDGSYTSKEDVALYIHTFGKLPGNFITKKQARKLGWSGGDLSKYAPGKSIGGDVFSNREGKLPKQKGRTWYECDIGYNGGSRNAKRIVFSDDGLVYYTGDHYKTYTQLY
ncbi:MAG: ribonuclease [Clostridia bacterium]|nr:ribonuclease [Clostridia bacterium]